MKLFRFLFCVVGLILLSEGSAAEYPVRPIRFIVPQPPGGGTDVVARQLAPRLTDTLKQQVVVENRAGAAGIVGTELAAKAPADGYAILLAYTGSFAINPHLYKNLPYRPLEDFACVSLAAASPLMLAVHPSLGVSSVPELIAAAKARPTPLAYGTPGTGSLHHLAMEWIRTSAGIQMVNVPYKGSLSFNAVVAGEVSAAFVSVLSALPIVRSGRVRAIGVTSRERLDVLPDVPTIAESGIPGFAAENWFGVAVPRRTPEAIVRRLNEIIAAYVKSPEVKERFEKTGARAIGSSPQEFEQLVRSEFKRWGEVVSKAGITVE